MSKFSENAISFAEFFTELICLDVPGKVLIYVQT